MANISTPSLASKEIGCSLPSPSPHSPVWSLVEGPGALSGLSVQEHSDLCLPVGIDDGSSGSFPIKPSPHSLQGRWCQDTQPELAWHIQTSAPLPHQHTRDSLGPPLSLQPGHNEGTLLVPRYPQSSGFQGPDHVTTIGLCPLCLSHPWPLHSGMGLWTRPTPLSSCSERLTALPEATELSPASQETGLLGKF